MKPFPFARALTLSSALSLALSFALSIPAFLFSSCSEGTSSGWDNPTVVAFVDVSGGPQKVSGELKIFSADQNPAIDPFPLARVRVMGASSTQLTQNDFERALGGSAEGLQFNLVFEGDSGTGALAMGLEYHSGAVTGTDFAKSLLEMTVQPLVRYRAKLALKPVHGDLGRVYIPGTAYQATLDEGAFTFDGLPAGELPLDLLNSDGYIFAVRESLDTRIGKVYTPAAASTGTLPGGNGPVIKIFRVDAGAARETLVGVANSIDATLIDADSTDARLSVLWRQIGKRDTANVRIANPTRLKSSVTFSSDGIYRIEVNVTLRTSTAKDTLTFSVHGITAPALLTVTQPKPGDSLIAGKEYAISWENPMPGPMTILFSSNGGAAWDTLAQHYTGGDGFPVFLWTPPQDKATKAGLIEVRDESDTASARMEGIFSILQAEPDVTP
ncbi:MAG: hypothetical protein JWO30_3463 [Fibrobacteres bacterium]|nr:hypothetical protein [Fibrobacterota bacterium]